MATYKTPDVYVEEISLLPPSVAEVETAIPCFIGYTEKAQHISENDLKMKAQKITSLLEYQQFFGGEAPVDEVTVTIDSSNVPVAASLTQKYYLYDSLRLFFDNGGGKCYIISVGGYTDDVTYGASAPESGLRGGLEVLKRKDEPTMILFPDAVLLSDSNELYKLQQQALQQCASLMDRVAICDLLNTATNENDSTNFDLDIESFRNKIGINNLKYGAAYTPWLKATLPKSVTYLDLTIERDGVGVDLKSLTTDKDLIQLIDNLDYATGLEKDLTSKLIDDVTSETDKTLSEHFQEQVDANKANILDGTSLSDALAIYSVIDSIAAAIILYDSTLSAVVDDPSLQIQEYNIKNDLTNLISQYEVVDEIQKAVYYGTAIGLSLPTGVITDWSLLTSGSEYDVINDKVNVGPPVPTDAEKGKMVYDVFLSVFSKFDSLVKELINAGNNMADVFETALYDSFNTYKSIIDLAKSELMEIPPSGAIAGIYAQVDRMRGVHKAPANVSLSSVSGLTVSIDSQEQEGLNIDVNAGKSVNALRYFTGQGILVWGARTLAGNDNEWRYISVRRFYNMVEESIKKSTYWAVFEANDANTWVRVKAMIENYLRDKWKEGALMGASPDDAFFVKIGLGQTMTAQDVLEGRMIVEIGMSVVRPAEFIILKFSHFMQES